MKRRFAASVLIPTALLAAGLAGCASDSEGADGSAFRGNAGDADSGTTYQASGTSQAYAAAPAFVPAAPATAEMNPFRDRFSGASATGFASYMRDGRLWVFEQGSEGLAEFQASGEPAKSVTLPAVGPGGVTVRSDDRGTVIEYLASTPGYHVEFKDDVLWIFESGSEALVEFQSFGEPAKNATMIGAGPNGVSIRSVDTETILGFLGWKPGFVTIGVEGRLWVFESGSDALAEFRRSGEPAKLATVLGVGPRSTTVRSDSTDTINAWLAARPGFVTVGDEDRIWIFEAGSAGLAEFRRVGEPAKSVTMLGAGPGRRTLRSDDKAVLMRYLGALPGYEVHADTEGDRLYVFASGSDGARDYLRHGEPAKSVTRIAAGPRGMTVISDDPAVLDRYLRAVAR